ncbi:hypothetical protein ACFLSQ_01815 [Bacteroidota bacterium]
MKRTTTKLFVAALAIFIAFSLNASAQLPAGSFGVGASFVGATPTANGFYALSSNLELGLGIGYQSESYDMDTEGYEAPDAETILYFQAMAKYFLAKGKDVSPYVGGILGYASGPTHATLSEEVSRTELAIGVIFGGQVFLAKQFAVYGHVALGYSSLSSTTDYTEPDIDDVTATTSRITLSGSGIGAIFYF